MPEGERRRLLVRCQSVTSAGYDADLVSLCKLLQSTAAR
ncbi:hypothetical protein SAMCCGM7_pC0893 (plasmid) [Sinorhizobium americanum CCGM7]|nr:hypothetical protein SAMCCGM7_pC0893 [Sinorhizobium americanum CCGM7]